MIINFLIWPTSIQEKNAIFPLEDETLIDSLTKLLVKANQVK